MPPAPTAAITEHFADLEDPRVDRTKRHELQDILVIAICAVICGADSWVDVEFFGNAKLKWFQTFLELPNGIPSHDTFGRVFARLNPEQFQRCFLEWIQSVAVISQGQVIAVDGKTLRRSHDKYLGKNAIVMVSAWASANHLVLGQLKVNEKSNEITAIPQLLQMLDVSGCIVTVDALGCQPEIAETIVSQEADYVLAVKENQGRLHEDIQELFVGAQEVGFHQVAHDYHKTVEKDHGRIEIRQCWITAEPELLHYLRGWEKWKGLQTLAMVRAERRQGSKITTETRYFISSLPSQARRLLAAVRGHWSIENSLHWVLDIAFREDDSRVRKDNAPQNFAVLRHITLNLLKQDKSAKCGIKSKRLLAGWDEAYLLKLLFG